MGYIIDKTGEDYIDERTGAVPESMAWYAAESVQLDDGDHAEIEGQHAFGPSPQSALLNLINGGS